MNHQDIVKLVQSMEIKPLTEDTFKDFVQSAYSLFVPKGAKFQEFYSKGENEITKDRYDFSKGKPDYQMGSKLIFNNIEHREILEKGKKWINVHFQNETHGCSDPGVWGIHTDRLPFRFGFSYGKALYISQHQGNGTPEKPWEEVYVKLE